MGCCRSAECGAGPELEASDSPQAALRAVLGPLRRRVHRQLHPYHRYQILIIKRINKYIFESIQVQTIIIINAFLKVFRYKQ